MGASNKRRKTLIINACPWAHGPPVQGKVSQAVNNTLAIVCGWDRLRNKIRTWAAVPEACSAVPVGHNRVWAPLLGGLGSSRGWGIPRQQWLTWWRVEFPSIALQRPQVCSPSLGASFFVLCPMLCRKRQSCSLPGSWTCPPRLHSLTPSSQPESHSAQDP